MQRFETHITFTCPVCNQSTFITVQVPELNWASAERMSDLYSEDQTEIVCPECDTEFPAEATSTTSGCTITLDDYPNMEFEGEPPFFSADPDDFWDYVDPVDPLHIFFESHNGSAKILAKHGGNRGSDLINRMVFAQQVSALEAYLGDMLVMRVMNDNDALNNLLVHDKELKKEQFGLVDIMKKPSLVKDTVRKYLKSILYHNLSKVAILYKIALDVDIWVDEGSKQKLYKAIHYRHDLVHRNGRTAEGERLEVFTREYVQEIADIMQKLVENIETQVYPTPEF